MALLKQIWNRFPFGGVLGYLRINIFPRIWLFFHRDLRETPFALSLEIVADEEFSSVHPNWQQEIQEIFQKVSEKFEQLGIILSIKEMGSWQHSDLNQAPELEVHDLKKVDELMEKRAQELGINIEDTAEFIKNIDKFGDIIAILIAKCGDIKVTRKVKVYNSFLLEELGRSISPQKDTVIVGLSGVESELWRHSFVTEYQTDEEKILMTYERATGITRAPHYIFIPVGKVNLSEHSERISKIWIHELAHIFGAVDVKDPSSVMVCVPTPIDLERLKVDPFTQKLILKGKSRFQKCKGLVKLD